MRWHLFAIACVGCGASDQRAVSSAIAPTPTTIRPSVSLNLFEQTREDEQLPACRDHVTRFDGGKARGEILASEVEAPLVILDLSDAWAPSLFGPGPDGAPQPYRTMYMQL